MEIKSLLKNIGVGVVTLFTGLKNWLHLEKESMKETDFLHADTNSRKFKVIVIIIGWACSKLGVAF